MENIRDQVSHLRREFDFDSLDKEDLPENPLDFFNSWLEKALKENIKDANAFVLSTAHKDEIDSRVVLLRDAYEEGLEFYTNYGSKKGKDILSNKNVALNFFWADFDRQIRIKAQLEVLSEKLSDRYFSSRPRESQIGAWASLQSQELDDRKSLEERYQHYKEKFEGEKVPRPAFWGGYLAKPFYYEFWQGRKSRLHDRFCYVKKEKVWLIKRLYP